MSASSPSRTSISEKSELQLLIVPEAVNIDHIKSGPFDPPPRPSQSAQPPPLEEANEPDPMPIVPELVVDSTTAASAPITAKKSPASPYPPMSRGARNNPFSAYSPAPVPAPAGAKKALSPIVAKTVVPEPFVADNGPLFMTSKVNPMADPSVYFRTPASRHLTPRFAALSTQRWDDHLNSPNIAGFDLRWHGDEALLESMEEVGASESAAVSSAY